MLMYCSRLRAYLEKHGVVKTQAQLTRDQMLAQMRTAYGSVANPIYSAWSTSYMVRDYNVFKTLYC